MTINICQQQSTPACLISYYVLNTLIIHAQVLMPEIPSVSYSPLFSCWCTTAPTTIYFPNCFPFHVCDLHVYYLGFVLLLARTHATRTGDRPRDCRHRWRASDGASFMMDLLIIIYF